jgi:hypothetical protein
MEHAKVTNLKFILFVFAEQLCITTISAQEDMVPLPIYLIILQGFERLILADVLSEDDTEQLVKLSVDRSVSALR